jgi:hypothetical protein
MRLTLSLTVMTALWALAATVPAWAGPTVEVPEPSSMALLAVGLGGAAWIKFRNRGK